MQTPIFLAKLSDESIIFIIDVGKKCTFVKISKKKIEKAYKRIIKLLKKIKFKLPKKICYSLAKSISILKNKVNHPPSMIMNVNISC
jgi:hypothetical protein